ncbi:uncharacterized protein LOC127872264 [Dreissena polymorpha]|uniref:uncharacterized protein LOC127872264 n=1 Tax=Dreissena polymorpha TaxID=45954 RepID=UPI002263CDF4|nr:uncharacterized protein LOC127872264 [Dreissena polymorpha]
MPYTTDHKQHPAKQLLLIAKDASLDQVVQSSTRITKYTSNLIDLFFTKNITLINKCETIPGIGDHEAIFVDSSLHPKKVKKPPRKDELLISLDKGKQHELAILDFSKAFDKVPHQRLLTKLHHYGISGQTIEWIRVFLTDRTH